MSPAAARDHGALMDSVYRGQRHFYDFTRKYYLFGRDKLIDRLALAPGESVLEIACGTGRNLAKIGRQWPGAKLFGLDISHEMLKSARDTLGSDAVLAHGDATAFDAQGALGRAQFDRVVLSYCLSMIPNWRGAIEQGIAVLGPRGSLYIVDFGDMRGLASPLSAGLRGWLTRFHVTPRTEMVDFCTALAARHRLTIRTRRGPFGYYRMITLARRRRG